MTNTLKKTFKTSVKLKFREADPAQIMYFANIFNLAHDAFEEFIVAVGYQYNDWFSRKLHIVPIRHCEADFLSPIRPGKEYEVLVSVAQIRDTSFQMNYDFFSGSQKHANVKMVHAVLNSDTLQKMPIPTQLRDKLSPYLSESMA